MEIINKNQIEESSIIKHVTFIPKYEIACSFVVGAILLFIPFLPIRLFGIVSLILGSVTVYKIKDFRTISFGKDYLYIYEFKSDEVKKISYDEIDEWGIKIGKAGPNALELVLKDKERVLATTYQTSVVRTYLFKILKNKEDVEKAIEERSFEGGLIKRSIKAFKKK